MNIKLIEIISNKHYKELISRSSTVFLSKLFGMTLSYVFIVFIARTYGASATGVFTLATTIGILFSLVGRIGLDTALLRFVSEYSAQNRHDLVAAVYRRGLKIIIPCSLVLSVVLYLTAPAIACHIFGKISITDDLQIISIAILPIACLLTNAEVLRAQRNTASFSFFQTISISLFSIVILIILRIFYRGDAVPVISYSLGALVSAFLSFLIVKINPMKPETLKSGSGSSVDLLRVSVPMMISNTLFFIMAWIDTFMIGVFRPESEVGIYSTALRIATMSTIMLFSIAGVVAPKFVEYHIKHDKPQFNNVIAAAASLNFWASFPFIVIILVAPSFLMGLFGAEFENGAPALIILAVGQLINAISGPSGLILQMTGKERLFQKIVVWTIVLNIMLDVLLIRQYGIIGAAIANTLSMLFWNASSVISVKSTYGIWSFYLPILRRYISWNWAWDLDSALRYEKAVSLIHRIKPETIVEVGSGNWGISSYAKYPSIAIDIAFDNRVRPGMQKRVVASGTDVPLPDDFADFVISTDMLEHIQQDQRPRVIKEMFRVVKHDGVVYIAVPVDEPSEEADRRVNDAFIARKGDSHPMLRDHIAHGLPSSLDMAHLVRSEATALGWSVAVYENTPISLWEWNLMLFGVERWIRGLRHFQRIILQPLYSILRKINSAYNYRIIIIARKSHDLHDSPSLLPSFFVVGAQRSGTTSLHEWLSCQKEISLPKIKETHFFSDDARYARGIEWYLMQFCDTRNKQIVGEVDPDYLFYEEAPYRIKKLIDSPKIIMIFRNPLERAYSHYLLSVSRGFETLPFDKALKEEQNRSVLKVKHSRSYYSYMARSTYSEQVLRYRSLFPQSEVLFIKFDDLYNQMKCHDTFIKICKFIGISGEPIIPDYTVKYNASVETKSTFIRNILYSENIILNTIKGIIRITVPSFDRRLRIGLYLDKLNKSSRMIITPDWRHTVPEDIWRKSNEEIYKLEFLTGMDLRNWIKRDI